MILNNIDNENDSHLQLQNSYGKDPSRQIGDFRMMMTGFALSYAAWFGMYHAKQPRSAYTYLSGSQLKSRVTCALSWGLIALALYPCIEALGLARGIALWIGLIVSAGFVFMFSAQIYPKLCKIIGLSSLAIAIFSYLLSI